MRRDRERAEDFARRHNVARFYDNADDLIADKEVNAIYIATPPVYHEEYTWRAAAAGKPVYVEKPVTLNSAACERMIAATEKHGVPAACAHYRRALPLYGEVKSLIRKGVLGKVRLIDIQLLKPAPRDKAKAGWRVNPDISGGGLFHDLAPHQLDILYWIFGAPVEVNGRSFNQSKVHEAPDLTYLQALFADEILLHGVWAFNVNASAELDSCRIIGDKGFVSFSFFKEPVLDLYTHDDPQRKTFQHPVNIQEPMIDAVVKYFRGEGENPCSLREALVSMQMMDAAS
jgi:predicted dehydrogenase